MGFGIKITRHLASGALFGIALASGTAHASSCDRSVVALRGDWGQANFSIEVADDPGERAQGLMNRDQMARNAGMLFIYDQPQVVAFWMRNTLIPLDMIFVDQAGLVLAIHENAIPLDETPIPGGQGVQFVLEVNGGIAALFGISVGSQVQHPGIDQNLALWACESQ